MKWAAIAAVLVLGLSAGARAGGEVTAPLVLAQSSLAVIDAPKRLDIDQETVDFTGRAIAPGEITLTVNGKPVPVARDGSFRIRQQVPVGRSRLLLVLEGSYGDKAEHKVFVRRTAATADEPAAFGRFHALVIGNDAYKHLKDLKMAVVDAEAVAGMLERRYGFDVEVLVDATRYDIISALSRLRAELNETDNLLIYYAGHGSLDIGSDEGYWLPVDAEPDNPVNWVSNNDISGQLRAMSAKHVMVVADSCYSGKLTRSVAASLKTGAERTAWLARMNGRRSRTALTSGGLEPVLDAGGGGHSVFAKAFLEALENNTQVLDGQALFDAIKRPIVVNADQTPEYADVRKAGHDGGDFLFVPVAVTPTATVAATAPAAPAAPAISPAEVALWSAVKDSQFAADYQAYLDAYPTGVYAPLAKARIARLEAGAESRAAAQGSAAELAFWNAIKDSAEAADYQAYLSQFPEGAFAALATLRLSTFGQAAEEAERKAAEAEAKRVAAVEAARVAAEEAKRQEAERKAAEEAARQEATRLAAEAEAKRVAAEEAARHAAEEAKRKEAERKAAARLAAEVEAKRVAAEQAKSKEAKRKAAEEAARATAEAEAKRKAAEQAKREVAEAEAKRLAAEEAKREEAARKAAEVRAAAAQRQAQERVLWDTIKDSNRAVDYQVYLQQFPGGTYAVLARARLAEAKRRTAEAERKRLAAEEAKRKEEERKAQQEIQTAMLAAPAKTAVAPSEEEILSDPNIGPAIINFYNKYRVKKRSRVWAMDFFESKIKAIKRMEIKNISENVITIIVDYSWNTRYEKGDDIGIATLEWTGSSYKVLKFKTGGMTYKAAERKGAEAQTAAAQRQAQERALWDTIKDSNRAVDYQVYLQQFPGGTYAVLAKARMVEAQRKATEETARKEAERKAKAEREARQEVQTALLIPTPKSVLPIKEEEILENQLIKEGIINFYNKAKVRQKHKMWADSFVTVMDTISDVKVLEISGGIARIVTIYRWEFSNLGYGSMGGTDRGIATIEKVESSYRILKFETGGMTYKARSN